MTNKLIKGIRTPHGDLKIDYESLANLPDIRGIIEEQIGDIDAALEELHNYAQALIGGEA